MRLSTLSGLLSSLHVRAILLGLAVGTLGATIDATSRLQLTEQEYGLASLFRLRGPRPPPEDVVIIAMNQRAADNISLSKNAIKFERCEDLQIGTTDDLHKTLPPPRTGRWPRCLHAQLTEALTAAGARVIVFDVLFRPRNPNSGSAGDLNQAQDERFAKAINASRNVLIAQYYQHYSKSAEAEPKNCVEDVPQALSEPIADAALGVAPMPYAPTKFASGVERADLFWTFKTCAVGWGAPTLPLLALQAYSLNVYPEFFALLNEHDGPDASLLPTTREEMSRSGQLQIRSLHLRALFKQDVNLTSRLLAALEQSGQATLSEPDKRLLRTLILAYGRDDNGFLNHYGPAGTIHTIGYDAALAAAASAPGVLAAEVEGKTVFVGYAEPSQPDRSEHWSTPFSNQSGIDTSGVELIATAFANLLTDSAIRPISPYLRFFISFAMGFAIATVCMYLPAAAGLAISGALATSYFGFAIIAFNNNLWLPLLVPIGIVGPTGVLAAAGWQYLDVVRDKKRLAKSLGLFVPPHVVEQLVQKPGAFESTRESLDCACLVTDAADYTTLSETLRSEQLAALLNQYFETLFRPVLQLGGYVSDVIGDSMLALWPDRNPGKEGRLRVCMACLDALAAVERFNTISPIAKLPTRFGIHFGPVTLGLVGALTHYEYRAVGDTVNASNRVQGLNKRLGTRLLASEPIVEGLDQQLLLRNLGLFRLKGKKVPIRVFEIVSQRDSATEENQLCADFAAALEAFQARDQDAARERFEQLVSRFPQDGPSAFYAAVIRKGIPADGVIDA